MVLQGIFNEAGNPDAGFLFAAIPPVSLMPFSFLFRCLVFVSHRKVVS
jgi:hypothetical protein